MTITRDGAADYMALATDYLPQFKSWARIDHDDDDDSLTLTLAGAIEQLSKQLGIDIARGVWLWIPISASAPGVTNRLACACAPQGWSSTYIPVPVRGVVSFTVSRGEPPVDVSAGFHLAGNLYWGDFGETFLASDAGAQVGDVVRLTGGTDTASDVPPALTNIVFRYGLFIWENRESATDKTIAEVPDFLLRAWSIYWTPRA